MKRKTRAEKHAVQGWVEVVLEENRAVLETLPDEAAQDFIVKLKDARSVFFCAQGRSGFILRCFCMRMMHLGFEVYFCGETITPAISQEDLLVVLSGSGETPATVAAVSSAKAQNAKTYGILGNMNSRAASLVDNSIHLPGTTKLCRDSEPGSQQMAGSLFEQSAFLFLEAVILDLFRQKEKEVGRLSARHATIE